MCTFEMKKINTHKWNTGDDILNQISMPSHAVIRERGAKNVFPVAIDCFDQRCVLR